MKYLVRVKQKEEFEDVKTRIRLHGFTVAGSVDRFGLIFVDGPENAENALKNIRGVDGVSEESVYKKMERKPK